MEVDNEGFSIREYTQRIRSVELRKCWPFSGETTGDLIQSVLPPITVAKFRWWSHELASLLAKSPPKVDDSDPKSKPKSKPCKKRSIVEIQLARREEERDDSDVSIGVKRKRRKNLTGDRKFAQKVNNCKESSGLMFISSKNGLGSKVEDCEFQIPAILKRSNVRCSDNSEIYAPRHVNFSAQSGELFQVEKNFESLELCCLEMNRLSLFSPEDQRSVTNKKTKVVFNDHISDGMTFESMQFQPAVSEKWSSHARGKPVLLCVPGPYLSSHNRGKGDVAQSIQSFTSSHYRSCSSSSQPDMHCGTLLYHSPFDPLLVEWKQKSDLYRQRNVEEAISGFPLNLQGQGCTSFDPSGLGTGSARFSSAENNLLVDFSSGKKHSIAKGNVDNFPVHNEKRHNYFPTRLGIDETFTEKSFFISDTNDGECGETVHSSVSDVNPMSNIINLSKQNGQNQNISSRNMVANPDDLCLHNTQATMRLMGKNVSVGTSYSDMVQTGERIIAHQSRLWQRSTLGVSENHSTLSLDKSWSRDLMCDTSKYPFPYVSCVPHSEFPPTILYPYGSLVSSCPFTDKDLSFHGSGLRQEPNIFTFSQQQLLFPSNPEISGLPSDNRNVGIGLLPDARQPYFGLPFSYTDSTRQSQSHLPQCSFESYGTGMSFIDPAEQLASYYGSKPSSCVDVGNAKKRLASVEEYPMKKKKVPKFPMQGGFNF